MEKLRLSYTRIQTFLSCRQRYKWSYIEGLAPKDKARPLQVGDIVHRLLHMWYVNKLTLDVLEHLDNLVLSICKENTEEQATSIALEAANLVGGYLEKYGKEDPLKFISSEITAEVELPDFILFGKIDALARTEDNRLWRCEHKTAGKVDSPYLSGLKGGLQGAIYDFLITKLFKEQPSGTVYNLLVKTKVPQYLRAYTKFSPTSVSRMLQTCEGVYRDIKREDYYPSSSCFGYNRECDYKILCDMDSPEVRKAFYIRKEDEHIVTLNEGQ